MTFADTIDKYEFSVTFLKKNTFTRELLFDIEYLDLFKGFEYIKGYTHIAEDMFNINKNLHLVLAPDEFDMASEVKNMKQIASNWKEFKRELNKNEELKKILNGKIEELITTGDKEYYSSKAICKTLNNHILYDTFFAGLFTNISSSAERHQIETKNYSRLFLVNPDKKVSVPLIRTVKVGKLKDSPKHMLIIKYKLDRDKLDENKLLEAMTQYPNLRQRVARYNYEVNYRYTFSPETNILEKYEYDYFEQINDDIESNRHCKVEMLDDKIVKYYG